MKCLAKECFIIASLFICSIAFGASQDTSANALMPQQMISSVKAHGNRHIGDYLIVSNIEIVHFYTPELMDEAVLRVKRLYSEQGFNECSVNITPIATTAKGVELSVEIQEGNQLIIDSITGHSKSNVKPDKILKKLKIKKGLPLNISNLDRNINLISDYYREKGFALVEVSSPILSYNADATRVSISININEGIPYTIAGIEVRGCTVISQKEALTATQPIKKGSKYKKSLIDNTIALIEDKYFQKGYFGCTIEPELAADDATGELRVILKVNEGKPYTLGEIKLTPLRWTDKKVILRELNPRGEKLTDGFSTRRFTASLLDLGYIDEVSTHFVPGREPGTMDLDVAIKEGKPGMLTAGLGYSTDYGLMGIIGLSHASLFGQGKILSLEYRFGERINGWGITLIEPWFLDKPRSLSLSLSDITRKESLNTGYSILYDAYKDNRRTAALRFAPRFQHTTLFCEYRFEDIRLYDLTVSTTRLTAASFSNEYRASASSMRIGIEHDSRVNSFEPSAAHREVLSIEYGGGPFGGTMEYLKPSIDLAFYTPLFWKLIFSADAHGKSIHYTTIDNNTLAYTFRIGGASTVRGYTRNGIGIPNGGNVIAYYTAEIKFPLGPRDAPWLSFFFDAGQTWASIDDMTFQIGDGPRELKSSIGVSIQMGSKIMPMMINYAHAQNEGITEEFSINIGSFFD